MKRPRRSQCLHLVAGAATLSILLAPLGDGSWSQTPVAIRLVVPLPPGSALDILSRLLADQIGRSQGPAIVIENRPGAAGSIGTEAVARAAPDGSVLLVNGNPFIVNPLVQRLNYHPLTSFEPVCNLVRSPTLIVVKNTAPYRTLADLLEAARARPGQLTVASIGPASATHIAFEVLKGEAKVDMTFVPFPGVPPALNALLGDHVTSVFALYSGEVAAQLKAGNVRALATASLTRTEALPDVPTVAEAGYKDYDVNFWGGVFAPAKTPNSILNQLAATFTAALRAPDVREKLAVQGFYPVAACGAEFAELLRKQYDDYQRIIHQANIKGG